MPDFSRKCRPTFPWHPGHIDFGFSILDGGLREHESRAEIGRWAECRTGQAPEHSLLYMGGVILGKLCPSDFGNFTSEVSCHVDERLLSRRNLLPGFCRDAHGCIRLGRWLEGRLRAGRFSGTAD